MVFVILALIWAAALLPPLLRSRLEGNPVDSIGRFRRHLRVLESTSPAASALANDPSLSGGSLSDGLWDRSTHRPMPAVWVNEARRLRRLRRRQQTATILLALMGTTLVIGLLPAFRLVLAAHVVADVLFVAYVGLLVRARTIETERQMSAHFAALEAEPVEAEPRLRSQAY